MAVNKNEENPTMARVIERNIEALMARRQREEQKKSLQNRVADRVTQFTGSMPFVYIHLAIFSVWISLNLGWTPRLAFDPTLVILAMFASVEAIFLSTFVLITQNRMAAQADLRADLDLQISLLAEHEVTRLITLVSAMAERMGVQIEPDTDLPELKRDVHPEQVLEKIEETGERLNSKPL
jgi:uncharacterized membrane protein